MCSGVVEAHATLLIVAGCVRIYVVVEKTCAVLEILNGTTGERAVRPLDCQVYCSRSEHLTN